MAIQSAQTVFRLNKSNINIDCFRKHVLVCTTFTYNIRYALESFHLPLHMQYKQGNEMEPRRNWSNRDCVGTMVMQLRVFEQKMPEKEDIQIEIKMAQRHNAKK